MGHATHFLTRIERLSAVQADLALGLYRDPGLVSFILHRVRLPDGADRVALALEHRNSPHVIVTRTGAFVTCLGAGMTVGETPVISRAQLDGLGEKFDVVRDGLARAVAGQESERLMTLLLVGGGALAREDFALLRAVVPVLGGELLQAASRVCLRFEQQRNDYRRSHYRVRDPAVRDVLEGFWKQVWTIGHLAALCSVYVEDRAECLSAAEHEELCWLLRPLLHVGTSTMAPCTLLRAAWGASRVGRPFLSRYCDRLLQTTAFAEVTHALVMLLSIALRHEDVRDEVSEVVRQNHERIEALPEQEMRATERGFWGWVHGHGRQMLAGHKHDEYVAFHRKHGVQRVLELGAALPAGHAQRWDAAEQVPDELAVVMLPSLDQSMLLPAEHRATPFLALPWVIGATVDELYVPQQYMSVYGTRFDAETTREMLDRHARLHGIGRPVHAPAKTGRNQSCPCGSGKKFKRCCGAGP